MPSQAEQAPVTPSKLMHQAVDQLSTIVSIAQLSLMSQDMSPTLQEDLQRIIQAAREASAQLKQLAGILQEDE